MTSAARPAGPGTVPTGTLGTMPTGTLGTVPTGTLGAVPTGAGPAETGAEQVHPAQQVPVPQDQAGIDSLRLEIDAVDAEIVRLIKRRTAISNAIGAARKSLGGPRIVYSREMAILERFRELGPAGTDLGMMLLAMGRGRLGRK